MMRYSEFDERDIYSDGELVEDDLFLLLVKILYL